MNRIWKQHPWLNALEIPSKKCSASENSSEEYYSNKKVNFNHEDLIINDFISEKRSNKPVSSSINETSSSISSNLELKTSSLRSKSLLMAEFSSFKKDYEAKVSKKRYKEEETKLHS